MDLGIEIMASPIICAVSFFSATTRTPHLAAEMFDLGRLLLPPARHLFVI
jgi:hypothetical protein